MLEIRKKLTEPKWNNVADQRADKDYLELPVITYRRIISEERLQTSMTPITMPNKTWKSP